MEARDDLAWIAPVCCAGLGVHSLRSGISQVSVQAVAGWSTGAMCQRYIKALAAELAIDEFRSRRAR